MASAAAGRRGGGGLRSAVEAGLFRCRLAPARTATIDGMAVAFANGEEFARIREHVFVDEDYRFAASTDAPFVLDCGAHIGLSVLYVKSRYPRARIVAFEPNPAVFALLSRNVRANRLTGVALVNAAVADVAGEIDFYAQRGGPRAWTWGGSGVRNLWLDPRSSRRIKVPAVRLAPYVDRPVDLLKLDVEGMEALVLAGNEDVLDRVNEVILEFHGSSTNRANGLERVLEILGRHGLDPTLRQGTRAVTPDQVERTDPYWLMVRARRP